MSTRTWLLGLFAIWGVLSFVHLAMVRKESVTFVIAYEAGYTLTMLLMSYVLWLVVRWLKGPQHGPELFKFTLIITAVLIIVVSLFGGTRFSASAYAQSQLSLRDAAMRIMGGSLVAPGVAAYCQKYVEANQSLLDAAQQWNRRNDSIMKRTVEALKLSGGISNDEKDILGRSAFKRTKELVESNNDRKEFCRNAVTNINNGSLDIDKMEGLIEAYKLVSSRAK